MVTYENILLPTATSGDPTGLSAEGIAGRVLLILTEVIALLIWVGMIALTLLAGCAGKHLPVYSEIQL